MDDVSSIYRRLADRFGERDDLERSATMDDVRRFVADHVRRLLDSNPALLMSILYRVDVSEARVQHILKKAPHDRIADRLTELIIERQLEKLQTRQRRRNGDDLSSNPS